MIKAKVVQMALEKMLKSPITQDARFQVKAGDRYYDVKSMKLLENQTRQEKLSIVEDGFSNVMHESADQYGCESPLYVRRSDKSSIGSTKYDW